MEDPRNLVAIHRELRQGPGASGDRDDRLLSEDARPTDGQFELTSSDEIPTLGLTRRRCEQIVGRGDHVLEEGLPGADRQHDEGSVECDLARSAPMTVARPRRGNPRLPPPTRSPKSVPLPMLEFLG